MRIFKNRMFDKWAGKIRLTDESLLKAAHEIAAGRYEASLGKKVFKKRVAIGNTGKSSGTRTIVAFQEGNNLFYMYGFEKGQRANINKFEKDALQEAAIVYLALSGNGLNDEVRAKRLIEIKQY